MITTNFDQTCINIDKRVRVNVVSSVMLWPTEWTYLSLKEKGTYRTEKTMGYEGPGAAPVVEEGSDITPTALIEGYKESATHEKFATSMAITYEMRRFAEANERFLKLISNYQSRSLMLSRENIVADLINDGWTIRTTGDGQYVFSASHVYKDGTTYSTLLTAAALDKSSLQVGLQASQDQVGEASIQRALKAKQVNIGTSNIFVLPELLKSSLDPETANNTYNAFLDWGLKKFVSHYFADTRQWVLDTDVDTRTLYINEGVLMWSDIDENQTLGLYCSSLIAGGIDNIYASFGNAGA